MIRQTLMAVILTIASFGVAYAQDGKKPIGDIPTIFTRMPCDTIQKMTETIGKYNEPLLFIGNGLTFSANTGQPQRGGMAFYVNQDTGTWTALQLFKDGMACMIMNGTNFEPYIGEQQ